LGRGVDSGNGMPVVRRLEDFDQGSGGRLERLIFGNRRLVLALSAALTVALGYLAATRCVLNADFERMIPAHHPFVRSYLENAAALRGLGNTLHVVVESVRGDVYDPAYLEALREVTDELSVAPGVDRPWVRSLWMPGVRWTEVTEDGFSGGPVMPEDYDGSPAALKALRRNVLRAGLTGSLVAADGHSSLVVVPLLGREASSGAGIDYWALSRRLEDLRARVEGEGAVRLHVVGFAKLAGDLLEGIRDVMAYFAAAVAISAVAIYLYTRCTRSTALVVLCGAVGVAWQLGIMALLGFALDPFLVLVPFLVFAVGVSHASQKMNGVLQDVARGTHRLVAARLTFRRLFLAGVVALLTDVAGFAALLVIDVPGVRELAIAASIGSLVLVFTSLVLLPVLLSYTGVSATAAARALAVEGRDSATWRFLERFTEPRWATGALLATAALVAAALALGRDLQVGDLHAGAPELRPSSRYNRDVAYLSAHYDVSSDLFAVVVKTPREQCLAYRALVEADRLGWALRELPGVRGTASLPDAVRQITAGSFEGNPKWLTLSRNQQVLNYAAHQAMTRNPDLVDTGCSVFPVVASLADHKAETLDRVVREVEGFAREHDAPEHRFLLAAGSAGLEAATNVVVRQAGWTVALWTYFSILLLCFLTFRSWRAVLVVAIPLACTSALCQAFMVCAGIGMKVATLPVISVGVGIPDFALYLLAVQLALQREGEPLGAAYGRSLRFTGKAVVLVCVTLSAGVVTWVWSPIQLQADMGLLLTFMFLGNMAAALVLVPALSCFLLRDATGSPQRFRSEPGP